MTEVDQEVAGRRRGTAYGVLAYAIWGVFPLFFHALRPASAWEILAHRILWTLAVCVGAVLLRRDLAWVRPFVANRRVLLGVTVAAVLLAINWGFYVYAVLIGRTYEAALGYFLNPLVTVALGVVVLGERLRRLQWIAVGVGAVAAGYLTVQGGTFPWIAIVLALSFGGYGLLKKRLGVSMTALHSLTAESAVLAPAAVVMVVVLAVRHEATFGTGAGHTTLLVVSGLVTAVPLLLFAAAARRIPLVTIGLLQFLTPMLQLLTSVLLLHEHVSGHMWVGFGIVWVALAVLTVDSLRAWPGRPARTPGDRR